MFRFDDSISADYQLVNSVYLDNCSCELYHGRLDKRPGAQAIRLRWYGTGVPKTVFVERKVHHEDWTGESSTKERFRLPEEKVLPYLRGDYTWDQVCPETLLLHCVPVLATIVCFSVHPQGVVQASCACFSPLLPESSSDVPFPCP